MRFANINRTTESNIVTQSRSIYRLENQVVVELVGSRRNKSTNGTPSRQANSARVKSEEILAINSAENK